MMSVKIQRVAETSFWAFPVYTGADASSSIRWVYAREYVDDASTIGRSLQLVDLPPHCTEQYASDLVAAIVARAGKSSRVESVTVSDRSAVVVLSEEGAAETLCAEAAKRGRESSGALLLPKAALESLADSSGLKTWVAEARTVCEIAEHPERLRAEADEVVKSFVAQKHAANVASEAAATEPDADGWVLVGAKRGGQQRKAKTGGVTVKSAPVHATKKMAAAAKKKNAVLQQVQQKELYQFDKRQSRSDTLDSLRRRFEADRERVEKMKANRKFKPY